MLTDIWRKCNGEDHITSLSDTAWRIVEAQDITATRKLVDSLEEQALLEELIESSKPALAKKLMELHPLLYTPFRYPPLKHGSRFGKRSEHSLWYGSLELSTAMAEKAFYQFNFLKASKAQYGVIEVPLTAFSIQIKTDRGIKLIDHPFSEYTKIISSPLSYERSQALGTAMRNANIQAFNYQSARIFHQGSNIALFTPKPFLHKKPNSKSFQSWQCIANNNLIEFIRSSAITAEHQSFSIDSFLVNGELPFPAN